MVNCCGCFASFRRTPRQSSRVKFQSPTYGGTPSRPYKDSPKPNRMTLSDLPSRLSQSPWRKEQSGGELAVLNLYSERMRQMDFNGCCALLAQDAGYHSMNGDLISSRAAIEVWIDEQARAGRRNREDKPWVQCNSAPHMWSREMKVTFPSRVTHDVIETATLEDGNITRIEMAPKCPALRTAMQFAEARKERDDRKALDLMSVNVSWKTWDGIEVRGKDAVKKLFRDMNGREVKRESTTEFECAQVNEVGGCFVRDLEIERVDGIKVKTKQKLYVMGELSELDPIELPNGGRRKCWGMVPKIVEVYVVTTEEMLHGKWMKCDSKMWA
mmetsp:Transcript_50624/g.128560  ORF Transcript_50624/g.128560 Transcript_50624/m.128560 type:complete len:328 (+) Transcript_50624:50-1033(+)